MQASAPHVRETLVKDHASRASESGQDLTQELIASRTYGLAPEEATAVDLSRLQLTDMGHPLGAMCPKLEIVNLQHNLLNRLPRTLPAAARARRASERPRPRRCAPPRLSRECALAAACRAPQRRCSASRSCASWT